MQIDPWAIEGLESRSLTEQLEIKTFDSACMPGNIITQSKLRMDYLETDYKKDGRYKHE